ncbi:ABC transporter permease [Bacillus horti]|uniref:ABC-2 type transport system permease protein n=1 Tax=Caldalkalibacillus horti TaxID=77523 RepID=A0ABT9W4Q3_9BACI|nr:ABC transporter permease [Bacillus horti]MDQ0168222.1 ABC-2 type transport system permease protein [Bacillus horti]
MKILHIALKELKALRDLRLTIFLLILPSIIVLILGTALSNLFTGHVTVGDIRVLYKNTAADHVLGKQWDEFMEEMNQSGVQVEPLANLMDGKKEVQTNRYTAYIEMNDQGIHYYDSPVNPIESHIVQGMLTQFKDRYNLATEVAQLGIRQDSLPQSSEGAAYILETSLDTTKQPSSMDYYAIAVTTLIIFFGAAGAGNLIDGERKRNTAIRLLAAPITKVEIFAGKILGTIAQYILSALVVVLITTFVFGVNWGGSYFVVVFFILLSLIIFVLSLGLGVSHLIKGETAKVVIMIFIQYSLFFGGSYFPVDSMTGLMKWLAYLSPLYWTNTGIMQTIYAHNVLASIPAILLNVGLAVLCLFSTVLLNKRREGL